MRLIDADVLIEKAHQESKGMSYPYREDFGLLVEWIVDKTPAVQPQQTCEYWHSESESCALCRPSVHPQPEIIRCKDCKHRDPEDKKCDCGHDILWQLPRDDDWFCADAERREEQHEHTD